MSLSFYSHFMGNALIPFALLHFNTVLQIAIDTSLFCILYRFSNPISALTLQALLSI